MEAIIRYIKYTDFDSQNFMKELKDETSKYFDNPVTCVDETDYEEYACKSVSESFRKTTRFLPKFLIPVRK